MSSKKFYIILLLILGLIPVFDLTLPGLPITHDGQDHVARIANFYQNLSEGNIIPRWAANLNWGYGHPILMFLYPLPSYIASFFHFLGFSLVDSTKIVFGSTFVLSAFAMYLWTRNFLPKEGALISSALYALAPYRFVDLYVRGAIGEHVAFLFMPLVLYFILKISKKYSKWFIAGGAVSIAGLILSHNAISIMFLPISFLYVLYLYSKQKKYIQGLVSIFILGLLVSAFFWIPAFFEGKYTLRDIVTAGDYSTRFVDFKNLLYGSWSYGGTGQFSVQIGIIQWIFMILSLPATLYLYKIKNRLWVLSLGLLLIFLSTIFLMLPYSNFIWEQIKTLQKFQFPWRFLSITVLTTSVIGGIVFSQIKKYKFFAVCLTLVSLLVVNKDYWKANEYKIIPEAFFKEVYNSTTDTGESSPIWSVRFMLERPKTHIEIIDGNAKVVEIFRNSTKHEYEIDVPNKAGIRENTVYFPGWTVEVDGKAVPVVFQDAHNRGVITFSVPKGKHNLSVIFKETKLRLLSNFLSLASFGFILIFLKFKKI